MCAATTAAATAAPVKLMACCGVVIRLLNRRRGDCVAIHQAYWFTVVLVAHWMMISWWSWWQAIWRGWLFHDLVVKYVADG